MACVYVHLFPNQKLYIGITSHNNPDKRWGVYGKGYENQSFVWKAIQKYGWDNIQHIILVSDIELEVAQEFEKCLIEKYKVRNPHFGYNACFGGATNAGYHHTEEYKEKLRQEMTGRYVGEKSPCYGKCLPEEIKKRISNTLTGRKVCDEVREKQSEALMGHPVTEETRQKISSAHRGVKLSEYHRIRISESHKGKGIGREGYWKGKTQSEETKRKRSESLKGRPKSAETIEKLRMSCKGKKHGSMSEEQKLKISLALRGKPKKRKESANA